MLRTNLSTRPFYNVRAVKAALAALGILVLALTIFNVVEIIRLAGAESALGARASEYEAQAARLRKEAAGIRAQVDPRELEVVAAAAREANTVIEQRAFSWSALMTQFEATLPDDVRITAVSPRSEDGRLIIGAAVEARSFEDLDAFVEALEAAGGFRDVLPVEQRTTTDGLVEAIVEGVYLQPSPPHDAAAAGGPEGAAPGGAGD